MNINENADTTQPAPETITVYLVGADEEDARAGLPFDSIESADSYREDQGGYIYSVQATIDYSTITLDS